MAAQKAFLCTGLFPVLSFLVGSGFFQSAAAVEFCGEADDAFVEMFGSGKGLRNNGGRTEAGQFQKNIKLRK